MDKKYNKHQVELKEYVKSTRKEDIEVSERLANDYNNKNEAYRRAGEEYVKAKIEYMKTPLGALETVVNVGKKFIENLIGLFKKKR